MKITYAKHNSPRALGRARIAALREAFPAERFRIQWVPRSLRATEKHGLQQEFAIYHKTGLFCWEEIDVNATFASCIDTDQEKRHDEQTDDR